MMMMLITHFIRAACYILSASKWLLCPGMSHFSRVLIVYQHCHSYFDADGILGLFIITLTIWNDNGILVTYIVTQPAETVKGLIYQKCSGEIRSRDSELRGWTPLRLSEQWACSEIVTTVKHEVKLILQCFIFPKYLISNWKCLRGTLHLLVVSHATIIWMNWLGLAMVLSNAQEILLRILQK